MSERRAFVCDKCYAAKAPLRIFAQPGEPAPKCPQHGRMRLEKNKPYNQQGTKT
jgi:hypothetical protein